MADTATKRSDTRRRWLSSALLTILLTLGLIVTSVAITISSVEVRENVFTTGTVKLNLNGSADAEDGKGAPVITEDDKFLFEPGMTVNKTFFLENRGADCWYKLYFNNVSGDLASVLDITIKDGDKLLCSGKMKDLTFTNAPIAGELRAGSRLDLTISFYFPKDAGNTAQNGTLQFDLCADATQFAHNGEDDKPPVFENE